MKIRIYWYRLLSMTVAPFDAVISVKISADIWWPALVLTRPSGFISCVEDNLFCVRILGIGSGDEIVPLQASSKGQTWTDNPVDYDAQCIPDTFKDKYELALEYLSTYIVPQQRGDRSQLHTYAHESLVVPSYSNNEDIRPETFRTDVDSFKRSNVLPWDDYFMAVSFLSAMRSKDPSTQVGACIVNPERRIVGIGYNGFPKGCSDDELPWCKEGKTDMDSKYLYVCHAEVNAVLNKNSADVRDCSIYVALFPCNECAKVIIQSGIKEVVYMSDKYRDSVSMRASRRLLDMAKVTYRQFVPSMKSVIISFDDMKPPTVK